jgi:hypothetical protein
MIPGSFSLSNTVSNMTQSKISDHRSMNCIHRASVLKVSKYSHYLKANENHRGENGESFSLLAFDILKMISTLLLM